MARKNWVVTGSDDMQVRVYNYNTLERVHQFEAHSDYVRCIAVHPTQPFILTCSGGWLAAHYLCSLVFSSVELSSEGLPSLQCPLGPLMIGWSSNGVGMHFSLLSPVCSSPKFFVFSQRWNFIDNGVLSGLPVFLCCSSFVDIHFKC